MSDTATEQTGETRRDFIYIATGAVAAVGGASLVWPFVAQMNPDASTLALGSIEVDLGAVAEGQQIKLLWRGKPVFIRHRTPDEIRKAEADDAVSMPDPQTDNERLVPDAEGNLKPQYLVMIGSCTHFGCVPVGESGEFDGWYCPCHGSHYDTSGRIRKGPAPLNLVVPPYQYVSDSVIKIG